MDTKLKADIAEFAVTKELLSRGFNVLKPVGDRSSAFNGSVPGKNTYFLFCCSIIT